MSKPRIAFYHRQQSAVGYYRSWVPARWLKAQGYKVKWNEKKSFRSEWGATPQDREAWAAKQFEKADVIWVDRLLTQEVLGLFVGIRHNTPEARMIVDFDDDFLNVPWWNPAQGKYQPGQESRETGLMHMKLAELTTVSTPPLVEAFAPRSHRIALCPNGIDPADWEGLPMDPEREGDPAVRVLYGGAMGHYGDTDVFRRAVENLVERPPVPWRLIAFGALSQWMHELRERFPQRIINLPFSSFETYPRAVAWGGFDLAVAPLLHDQPFNEAKSSIKWLEAAIQGIPFVCSKVGPYERDVPAEAAIRVENTPEAWEEGLRAALTDVGLRERLRLLAYEAVRDTGTIDRTGRLWENAVETAVAAPRILSREDCILPGEREPSNGPGPEPSSPEGAQA